MSESADHTDQDSEAQDEEAQPVGVIRGTEVTPSEDEALAWIAKGYGREIDSAYCLKAGDEAGEDAGQWFYELAYSECSIAIRADCMRAYLATASKLASLPKLSKLLRTCGFAELDEFSAEEVRSTVMTGSQWLLIADGKASVSPEGAVFCVPGEPDSHIQEATLASLSIELKELDDAEKLEEETARSYRGYAAAPGDVIARVETDRVAEHGHDILGRELVEEARFRAPDAGKWVEREGDEFRATRYGYVSLLDGCLSLVSPVQVDADAMAVHWCLLEHRGCNVTPELLGEWLDEAAVTEGVKEADIERMVPLAQLGAHKRGTYVIAAGTPPAHGNDARVEVLIDLERRAGKTRDDGSIDYRETNFAPNVQVEQKVVRVTPPTKGTHGRNVRAEEIPGRDGEDVELRAGANVRMEQDDDGIRTYFAEAEGALKYVPGEVAVVETLIIEGDVGFDTGNLQFKGEIVVRGNVGQGFAVKAGGDVAVFGSVDAGAVIASGGNVSVGYGVLGRKTKVVAVGDVRAQFVQEARVRAGHNLRLGNYAHQGLLRAGTRVIVSRGEGTRGGSLVGGECWGLRGISCHFAGSPTFSRTELVVGVDPEQVQKLDLLSRKLEDSQKLLMRQLERFGLKSVDVKAIQQRLVASAGPQKKLLARAARQLGEVVQVHQGLLKEKRVIEQGMVANLAGAVIEVTDQALPGVCIRIGDRQRQLKDEIQKARFHINRELLQER